MKRANEIAEVLRGKGYEAAVKETVKGGARMIAINVMVDEHLGVALYPEKFEGDAEQVAEQIIEILATEEKNRPVFNVNELTDWESIKDKLQIAIRPVVDGTEHITKSYLDLELVVRAHINNEASATVTKDLCRSWNKTPDEVFAQAESNKQEVVVKEMADVLAELMGDLPKEMFGFLPPMYVISNSTGHYGASALTNKLIFENLAEMLDGDLYIIPSSIHELIVIKTDTEPEIVNQMIKDVNNTEVAKEEVLCDHTYKFDRKLGEITY